MEDLKSKAVAIFAARRHYNLYPNRIIKLKRNIIDAHIKYNENGDVGLLQSILNLDRKLRVLEVEFEELKVALPRLEAEFLAASLDKFR